MKKRKLYLLMSIITISSFNAQNGNGVAGGFTPINYEKQNNSNYDKDFGVDLYTGTININIPLQELKTDNISLNLGLNYDTSGVLVNNVSGIVGQNWNLNAGGSITRKIKGMWFDELSHAWVYSPEAGQNVAPIPMTGEFEPRERGFFHMKKLLTPSNWNTPEYLKHILNRANFNQYPNNPTSAIIPLNDGSWKADTEPDIFYFNFLGKSGYFFMGEDGKWKVSSKDNLKVVDYNENTDLINPVEGINKTPTVLLSRDYKRKSIGRLTLIDDKGFQYIFGDNDVKSMEIHLGNYFDSEYAWPYVMKWNLKKVINPNGITLFNFEYITGAYFLNNLHCNATYEISSSAEQQNQTTGYSSVPPGEDASMYKLYKASGYLYKPSYLKKIISNTGENVNFEYQVNDNIKYTNSNNPLFSTNLKYNNFFESKFIYNDGGLSTDEIPSSNTLNHVRYVLKEIKINFNNKLVNTFVFQYANATPRVFLYQITKNNDEKHQFFYNYPNDLPGYLSEKTDMWGYYNGYNTSVSYSGLYAFWQNYEANKYFTRGTVTPKMLNGSLQKIIWPTGGNTDFVFEAHTFRQRVSNTYTIPDAPVLLETFPNGGGGLRIKKIINEGKEREFFYNNSFDDMNNNISSGILMYEPLFFERHNVYVPPSINENEVSYNSGGTSSANGINLKSDFFSSNVAYNTVFEKINDGYIKYTFRNFNDFPDYYMGGLRPGNKVAKKTDHTFERGQIKSKTYFDTNQNKILETFYSYSQLSNLASRGIEYDLFTSNWYYYCMSNPIDHSGYCGIPQPDCLVCNSKVSPYLIYYSDKVLDSEATTEYFKDGRKIESLKKYYYKSPLDLSYSLIDKIEEYPNKYDLSKFKTTIYDYVVDINTSDPPFTDMLSKNMVGIPLAVTQYNEQNEPISRTETIYAKNSITNNLVLPVSTRTSKTGTYGYGNDAAVHKQVTYDLYDAHGRILQYTDGSGIPTTIIWGYNRSQPIAKITGATYNQVEANINIGYLQDASDADIDVASENILISLLDDLRKNMAFKDHQITTYTYDPLVGITSLTNPDGLREYYKYNAQNKLEKIINVEGKILEEYQYHYKN